jgi:hypothetical protein
MDILGRSIEVLSKQPPQESVRRWLNGWSTSVIELRKKPIIIISPAEKLGQRL